MRFLFCVLVASVPCIATAQPLTAEQKSETLKWVLKQQDPKGGFYPGPTSENAARTKPGLRATSSAVRVIRYLGAEIPNRDKNRDFVLACYDAKTGGFAEPGGQPDVAITSVGVMAAVELGIPHDKFGKSLDYLQEHAKTFEEVRIAAAAVEAWGVKDCPFKLTPWQDAANKYVMSFPKEMTIVDLQDGESREWGSVMAFNLRLDLVKPMVYESTLLLVGQRNDGGWSKKGEKASDLESTYRVMRALMLLKAKPKNILAVRKFVDSHRNKDGGYGAKLAEPSSVSGTYYAVIINKWLDEMDKE